MRLFKSDTDTHEENLEEEAMYASVAAEMAKGVISPGLYTKALSECDGNETLARAKYIKMRVEMMKSEHAALLEQERLARIQQKSASTSQQQKPIPVENTSAPQLHPIIRFFCILFGLLSLSAPFWMGRFEPIVLIMVAMGIWFLMCGVKGKSFNPFTGSVE